VARFSIGNLFFSGSRVRIERNGKVYVDGDMTGNFGGTQEKPTVIEVRVLEGVLESLESQMGVTCGPVQGNVDAGMDVTVNGNVGGKVKSGMEVNCGDVTGDVDAGMSVNCGTVGGKVKAGMSVNHR
jgi:hypothetical protein